MRRRITVLAMATALLAVTLLAVPLGILFARNYLKDERLELQQAAASYAARVRGDLSGDGLPVDHEISATIYDAARHRVTDTGPSAPPPVVIAALAGRESSATSGNSLEVAAPISDGDRVTGAVLLRTSLDAAHHRALTTWIALGSMCILAVAVSGVAARLVAVRLTRPIDRLAGVARSVGNGDLSARAEPSAVAELDVLGTALNDSTQQIQSMIGRERAFSAEVSHQLRTPLGSLRLALEAGSVDRALPEVDRLDATITELIALARDLPTTSRSSLRALLSDVDRRWHGRLAARTRPLRVVIDEAGPDSIAMSAAAAGHVLDVLVDNAFRHGTGAITVRTRPGDATTAVEVSDEGPPLAIESHELFRRRDTDRGHGMGLVLARRLAEAEGARVVLARPDPPTFALVVATIAQR